MFPFKKQIYVCFLLGEKSVEIWRNNHWHVGICRRCNVVAQYKQQPCFDTFSTLVSVVFSISQISEKWDIVKQGNAHLVSAATTFLVGDRLLVQRLYIKAGYFCERK